MEDPFKGITPAKVNDFEDSSELRSLTTSYVFCPKCGKKNTFELSNSGSQLVYFCSRCSAKLNAFWESHQDGEMIIVNCKSCQQLTFKDLKYCISCGSQQKAVVRKRSKVISSQVRDSTIKVKKPPQIAWDCCLYGPIDAIIGAKFGKSSQRRYRNWGYAFSGILCVAIILFIVLWFSLG